MGCFDYNCECRGKNCDHTGGQSSGANVYIEVPLSDGTVVYLKGYYEGYGYVLVYINEHAQKVNVYFFYLKEFEEFFQDWFNRDSPEKLNKSFLATKVWTDSELSWSTDKFGDELEGTITRKCFNSIKDEHTYATSELIENCIRADKGLNILSPEERQKNRIEDLKTQLDDIRKELGRIDRP